MSESNRLKPGFVPIGWLKGEPVKNTPPRPGADHDGRHSVGMVTLVDPEGRAGQGAEVFRAAFYYLGSEADEVHDWLEWWDGSPADPQVGGFAPDPEPTKEEMARLNVGRKEKTKAP
jgi:hypothetical protein